MIIIPIEDQLNWWIFKLFLGLLC